MMSFQKVKNTQSYLKIGNFDSRLNLRHMDKYKNDSQFQKFISNLKGYKNFSQKSQLQSSTNSSAISFKIKTQAYQMFNYEKFHKYYSKMQNIEQNQDFWYNRTNENGLNERIIFQYASNCYKLGIKPLPLIKYFYGESFILENYTITAKQCEALLILFQH